MTSTSDIGDRLKRQMARLISMPSSTRSLAVPSRGKVRAPRPAPVNVRRLNGL